MRGQARFHRDAMIKEYKRREENKKEQLRQQKEKEEQKRQRKAARAAARERHRINLLLEKIGTTTIAGQSLEEFNPATTRIYDIRDPEAKRDGIFVIGGLVGELIITFTCLLDYILANPQNTNFLFTTEGIEAFLKDLLLTENFTENCMTLHLASNPSGVEGEDFSSVDQESLAKFASQKGLQSDFGLALLFEL
jgi:hypothetical protein